MWGLCDKSQFIEMFGTSCDSVKTILSDFVSLKAGKNKKSELIKDVFTDGLYPCYGGNGIRGYVEDYTHSGIYCIIGRQGAQCGNVQIAEGEFYATEHAVVVTPLTDVNSIWLFHALTQMNLNQYARGAAQPGLAVNQLEILPFSLPSIASQTQFALIAEQADKSKFADFKSQFIEMFKDCPIVKLEDNIKTQSGGTPNTKKQEYYNGGDIPWLSSGEVNQGYIFSTEKFITQAGLDNSSAKWVPKYSVLIAMYGATAGKVGFSMIPLTTNQAVCALLPCSSFNSLFLYYAVSQKTDWMISQCRGAAQPNISQGIIRSMEIAKPPMEQQEQFAAIAEQADKSKSHVLKALKETEILLQHSIRQVV